VLPVLDTVRPETDPDKVVDESTGVLDVAELGVVVVDEVAGVEEVDAVVDAVVPVEVEAVDDVVDVVVEDVVVDMVELDAVEAGRAVRSRARSWECGTGVWRLVPSE